MNASPPSTSGSRGSTTTTSGLASRDELERGAGLAGARRRPSSRSPIAEQPATGSRGPDRPHRRRATRSGRRSPGVGSCIDAMVAGRGRARGTDLRRCPGSAERRGPPTSSVADGRTAVGPRRGAASAPPAIATASGTTTSMVVPLPRHALAARTARRSGRRGRASRPARGGRPGRGAGSKPLPSSLTRRRTPLAIRPTSSRTWRAAGVLDDVVERLLGDPVEGLLDRQRQALVERALDDDRQPDPALERRRVGLERADQPVLLEVAGPELEDQRPHLGERLALEVAQLGRAGPGPRPGRGRAASRPSARRGSSRTAPG